jgi:hypothetical protein
MRYGHTSRTRYAMIENKTDEILNLANFFPSSPATMLELCNWWNVLKRFNRILCFPSEFDGTNIWETISFLHDKNSDVSYYHN